MNQTSNANRVLRQIAAAGLASTLGITLAACKSSNGQAPITNADPATANMAQPYTGGTAGGYNANAQPTSQQPVRVLGQTQSYAGQGNGEAYEQQEPAPIIRQVPASAPQGGYAQPYQAEPYPSQSYQTAQGQVTYDNNATYDPNAYNEYDDAAAAGEDAIAEADQAPPPLPDYDQPPAPADDYLWTPGYWNYANAGYFWVPGAWVAPPFYGALWTPPWWGFYGGRYRFHHGYWGPHVGFYGGINYGFGYVGYGYYGGYWQDRHFLYNRAVTNVNINIVRNVYNRPVIINNVTYGARPFNRVSYNGGRGGIMVQPRPAEFAALHEPHYAPVAAQRDLRLAAAGNRSQFFRDNGGRPAQAFAGRPIGTPQAIAAAPHEQPINRGFLTNNQRPGFNGNQPQPGAYNNQRPGFNGNQPQPGAYNNQRPGFNGNQPQPGAYNNQRPGFNGNQTQPGGGNNQRPAPNANQPQPANNTQQPGFQRPGDTNRPGYIGTQQQPAYNRDRPATQPATGFNNGQPTSVARPQSDMRLNRGAEDSPTTNDRPGQFQGGMRPVQPQAQPQPQPQVQQPYTRPGLNQQRNPPPQTQIPAQQPTPYTRPNFGGQPNAQPQNIYRQNPGGGQRSSDFQPGNRQGYTPQPAAQPQPAARPNFEAQRPAPQFVQRQAPTSSPQPQFIPRSAPQPQVATPRPAPAPAPAPAPHAEAPHGNGPGDHGHPH